MTFSMPSAARYLSLSKAADSPPLDAQLTPMSPDLQASSGAPRWFICFKSTGYISFIAITASTFDSGRQMDCLTAVIFAGHGVIKIFRYPKSRVLFCLRLAARYQSRSLHGRIERQDMRDKVREADPYQPADRRARRGYYRPGYIVLGDVFRVASLTSSAPLATSNTSSKPSILSAVMTYPISSRLLNCP